VKPFSEVRFYVEGGGDSDLTRKRLRKGFRQFLDPLQKIANAKNIKKWDIVACGGRQDTYEDFCHALATEKAAFCILVVDSEDPVTAKTLWEHLQKRDSWACPVGATETHCYLMVTCMETWLLADVARLKTFYGKDFKENALPQNASLESVDRHKAEDYLKTASKGTTAGAYHKTKHGFEILENANADTIRKACPSCERLFVELEKILNAI
jgi:Domain of unknown function (DUF4276)